VSPDGKRIAYRVMGGVSRIWVMDADGSGKHRLGGPTGKQLVPSWQPVR